MTPALSCESRVGATAQLPEPRRANAADATAKSSLERAAIAAREMLASGGDEGFCRAKIATARFYAEQILPKTIALLTAVKSGASTAFALDEEQF